MIHGSYGTNPQKILYNILSHQRRKLSFWQFSMHPIVEMLSIWRHFRFREWTRYLGPLLLTWFNTLRWRHNDHAGVSNHQPHGCLLNRLNQRKHQSSASLAFVREIHRGPVNFPHKWPVTRKMFPFDDVIMISKHMSSTVCDEITYAFASFNGASVQVWEYIRNFMPRFIMD